MKFGDKIFSFSKNLKHKVMIKIMIDLFADYDFSPFMKHRVKSFSSTSNAQNGNLETSSISNRDDL